MFKRMFVLTALAVLGLYIINFKINIEDYGKIIFSVAYLIIMFMINSMPMCSTQNRIVRYYFEIKEYEKAKLYLEKKVNNLFYRIIIRNTRINLMFTYIYLDQIDEAKRIIDEIKNKKCHYLHKVAFLGAELVIKKEKGQDVESNFEKYLPSMYTLARKANVFKALYIEHFRLTEIINYIMSNEKKDHDSYFIEENMKKWPIFKRIVEKEQALEEVPYDNN